MQLSSLSGFMEFILTFLLIYFALKLVMKYYGKAIMRFFLRQLGKRVEKKFRQNSNSYTAPSQPSQEPTIEHKAANQHKSKVNKDTGEYIEFEEID